MPTCRIFASPGCKANKQDLSGPWSKVILTTIRVCLLEDMMKANMWDWRQYRRWDNGVKRTEKNQRRNWKTGNEHTPTQVYTQISSLPLPQPPQEAESNVDTNTHAITHSDTDTHTDKNICSNTSLWSSLFGLGRSSFYIVHVRFVWSK